MKIINLKTGEVRTKEPPPLPKCEVCSIEVEEKFGVSPNKVIQIQALTGDKVDNIPGAPGVGPKTAAEMINNFDDIEGLIKNYKKIKQEKKQIIIKENQENIRLSLIINLFNTAFLKYKYIVVKKNYYTKYNASNR